MPQELEISKPNSIRLSADVAEIGQYVATEMGLSSAREAIEAIVRKHWQEYLSGVVATAPQPIPTPQATPINAAQALDSVC